MRKKYVVQTRYYEDFEVRLLDWSLISSDETCVQFITDNLILLTGKQSNLIRKVYSLFVSLKELWQFCGGQKGQKGQKQEVEWQH